MNRLRRHDLLTPSGAAALASQWLGLPIGERAIRLACERKELSAHPLIGASGDRTGWAIRHESLEKWPGPRPVGRPPLSRGVAS